MREEVAEAAATMASVRERIRRWYRQRDEIGFEAVVLILAGLLAFYMGLAYGSAEGTAEAASAMVAGLAGLTAIVAIVVARRTYAEQRRARLEDAAERRRRRLEAIAELVLQIAEAASSGGRDRWRLARRRLRVALDAIGSEVELGETRSLAEVDVSQQTEGQGTVQAQLALDEIGERFADAPRVP